MEPGAERILRLITEGKHDEAVALKMNTETWGVEVEEGLDGRPVLMVCSRCPTGEHREQDAGDHQGPPFPTPPPSPPRMLMSFLLG